MQKKYLLISALILILGTAFYFFSRYNYLFFHTTIEFFTIVIGLLIFIISWISGKFPQNSFFNAFGPGILVVSLITFLHTITYRGAGIIPGYDANLPTQLWVVLSVTLATSFLFSLLQENRKKLLYALIFLNVVFGGLFTLFCFLRIFPDCYIEGTGLTLFKKIMEYFVILLYVLCIFILITKKRNFSDKLFKGLIMVLCLNIVSGFMFTLYTNVFGISNFLGHYIRLIAFVILYQFVVVEGITKPYDNVFSKLRDLSVKDGLTELYNHRSLLEFLTKFQKSYATTKLSLYLANFDIDNFKTVNDTFGHLIGDEVLKAVAKTITDNIRKDDIAIRQGGDEFSIIFPNADNLQVKKIIGKLSENLANNTFTEHKIKITLSGGVVKYTGEDINTFLKRTDQLLFDAKQKGKNQFFVNL